MRRLDVALALFVTAAALAPSIPELRGEHAVVMDLAVQAHKVYLLGTAGPARGDWDPYSYTGRPPLINYPIVPFLPAVVVFELTGNPYLACTVVDGLYRALPCWVWVLLRRLGAGTPRAEAVALFYAGSIPTQLLEAFTVRLVTTYSLALITVGILLARCELRRRWPVALAWSLAALGNPVYVLPALLLEARRDRTLPLTLLPALPPAAVGGWYTHLAFSYAPGSWFHHVIAADVPLLAGVAVLLAPLIPLAFRSGAGTVVLSTSVATLGLVAVGPHGPLRFIDAGRAPVIVLSAGVAGARRGGPGLRRLATVFAALSAAGFCTLAAAIAVHPHLRVVPSHDYRVLVDDGSGIESASPVWSGRPVCLLSGAFYQGASEPQLHALAPALELLMTTQPHCNWYLAAWGWEREEARRVVRKSLERYLRTLPVRRVDVAVAGRSSDALPRAAAPSRIRKVISPELSLRDAIPVERVRVLYVGSFTVYGVLWARLAGEVGRPPLVPGLYPPAVEAGQELSPEELPWTGEVLVVDRMGWRWAVRKGLVSRARRVVRVSCPVLPWGRGVSVDRAADELAPYLSSRIHVDRRSVSWHRDTLVVRERGFVVIPWGWAPFWSVGGREGRTCPVGPFMMVHVGRGAAVLRYEGWERYQRWAYLASGALLLAVLAAVGRKPL